MPADVPRGTAAVGLECSSTSGPGSSNSGARFRRSRPFQCRPDRSPWRGSSERGQKETPSKESRTAALTRIVIPRPVASWKSIEGRPQPHMPTTSACAAWSPQRRRSLELDGRSSASSAARFPLGSATCRSSPASAANPHDVCGCTHMTRTGCVRSIGFRDQHCPAPCGCSRHTGSTPKQGPCSALRIPCPHRGISIRNCRWSLVEFTYVAPVQHSRQRAGRDALARCGDG